jgi:hypothetical protein
VNNLAIQYRLNKELEVKVSHKMLSEFGKVSLSSLVKIILKKYIDGEFSLTEEEILKRFDDLERTERKNLYKVRDLVEKFDNELKKRAAFNKDRRRSATLEVCLLKWLNDDFKITKEEFMEQYNN